jgi:hypothetical protein
MARLESQKHSREHVEQFFRQTAAENIRKSEKNNFESLLDEDDQGKRILMVIPESAGDIYMATSLFPSIKRLYPDYNFYFSCKSQFKDILAGNPYVHKFLPYDIRMENLHFLEGEGAHEGWFEIAFLPFVTTQRQFTYHHNDSKEIIDFDLKCIS